MTDRTGQRVKEIAVMDADGFGQNNTPLTRHGRLCLSPTWGANGAEFSFTSYRDYNPDLFGVTLDGKREWHLSRSPGLNTLPNWCQANSNLLLVLSKDGNSELYTCDRSGAGMQRLTTSRFIESSPSWSPDGSMIAYTSDRVGGRPQIFVMAANGTGARQLTMQGSWNDAPSWSPKGDKIAFVSRGPEGKFDIYTCSTIPASSLLRQHPHRPTATSRRYRPRVWMNHRQQSRPLTASTGRPRP